MAEEFEYEMQGIRFDQNQKSFKDECINSIIEQVHKHLASGVPREQLFFLFKSVYKTVLSDGEIKLAINSALYKKEFKPK